MSLYGICLLLIWNWFCIIFIWPVHLFSLFPWVYSVSKINRKSLMDRNHILSFIYDFPQPFCILGRMNVLQFSEWITRKISHRVRTHFWAGCFAINYVIVLFCCDNKGRKLQPTYTNLLFINGLSKCPLKYNKL